MGIVNKIKPLIVKALNDLYSKDPLDAGFWETDLTINSTKPEFEGDYTLVLFSFVKQLKENQNIIHKIRVFLNYIGVIETCIQLLSKRCKSHDLRHIPGNDHQHWNGIVITLCNSAYQF